MFVDVTVATQTCHLVQFEHYSTCLTGSLAKSRIAISLALTYPLDQQPRQVSHGYLVLTTDVVYLAGLSFMNDDVKSFRDIGYVEKMASGFTVTMDTTVNHYIDK